jgi:hypothetical protein
MSARRTTTYLSICLLLVCDIVAGIPCPRMTLLRLFRWVA